METLFNSRMNTAHRANIVTFDGLNTKSPSRPPSHLSSKKVIKEKPALSDGGAISSDMQTTVVAREDELTKLIPKLWVDQEDRVTSLRRSKTEIAEEKAKLAAYLAEYKGMLATTGRNGRWASFLRESNIPLTRADRYVKRHNQINGSEPKLVSDDIQDPTSAQIRKMVKLTVAKLTKTLRTLEAVSMFMVDFNQTMQAAKGDIQPRATNGLPT